MEPVVLSERVNIMITPQFYTLKKEFLPLKYIYQAKKIAPSIFYGLLEEEERYDYSVFKEEENMWTFIAYDSEKIIHFLASKGIHSDQVAKLFFVEQSLALFHRPIYLSKDESLIVLDNTMVIVPNIALGEDTKTAVVFDNSFTPKKGLALQKGQGLLLEEKEAFSLGLIFLFFASVFLFEGLTYGGKSKVIQKELQTLTEMHPSLESTYTRNPELEKYKNINEVEHQKRIFVKAISGMIFKGVILKSLIVNEKSFKVYFSCSNIKVLARVEALAKKEQYNVTKIKNTNEITIEGTL